ncbi:arylsulfatase [Saccharicrinis fermentans]|uniref:Arylsulfatase n=1 Tax=Saccharicrinis fermentans DSM 9555 = JCM 21142 TaxID=869213 RepID=W7YE07_9BACT|nr:arylsulfatase [Saccharicrinis fermentans]GAF02691.1 arylsulfatase precursor [Saccharicrinis fermentans DSM 9555 = JCM 21142]
MKFKTTFIVLAALSIVASCTQAKSTESKKELKPNVIVVITDDQGYGDLACNGNPIIQTPNIDKFHDQSVRLTNFHVGTTCAPSRGGLMSGRNCNRNGVWHTIGGCSSLHERETTLADVFVANGYATGMFGKWHLGDNYPFRPYDRGFQETFYLKGGGVGQTPDYWNNDYFDDTYFRNGVPEKVEGYCTDVWFDEATKFIDKHKDEPFFAYVSLNAPHGPYNVPEQYVSMYDEADLAPRQKNFYGMITQLDERFGQLAEHLESTGIADNTILIFMTDNGTAAGYYYNKKNKSFTGYNAGMRGTKGSHYDGGHRVPFFIRWPKGELMGAKDIQSLTAHVDILPTLVELCGLDVNYKYEMDGISIASLLYGKKAEVDFDKRMLVTDTQRNQWPEKGRNSCVMTTRWRLTNGNELYDIFADPGQKNNIADKHPEQVKLMQDFYNDWWSRAEKDFEYPVIKLGTDNENPSFLTCHDMHNNQPIPWNQNMIRAGVAFDEGYLLTQVMQAGKYRIAISRYPKESGLRMDASVPGVKATKGTEAITEGVSLKLNQPFVVLNGKVVNCKFNDAHTAAEVSVDLEAGELKLGGGFFDDNGQKAMAYYYEVERL